MSTSIKLLVPVFKCLLLRRAKIVATAGSPAFDQRLSTAQEVQALWQVWHEAADRWQKYPDKKPKKGENSGKPSGESLVQNQVQNLESLRERGKASQKVSSERSQMRMLMMPMKRMQVMSLRVKIMGMLQRQ